MARDYIAELPEKTKANLEHQRWVTDNAIGYSKDKGLYTPNESAAREAMDMVPGLMGSISKFVPKATNVLKASEALAPHEGKWLNVTQSDRMRSTEGDLGGPGFSKFQLEKPEYAAAQAAWGVGKKPTASGIVNVNKKFGDQAIWTPMIGGETQHHSNQHVYDMLTNEFNRQSRLGNLTPELQAKINSTLATGKETKGLFPENFDIGNPEHLAQYGDTFNRRGALSTLMSGKGVGGTKGRIIDYPGIMQEMTDPMTVGAPTHSLGTRLFTLNNEIEHRPDLHSAFPYILKGEDKGVAFAPVPKEHGIPDFINQFKEFKGREPGYYDLVRTTPSQQVTDKYLRSLEDIGHADGGLVFNPRGKDYDYQTATAYGMGPNGTGENAGHWGSVAPTSDDERMLHGLPEDSYVVLKGKSHPTFHKAEAAEEERGSKIVKAGDRYYSIPK